MPNLASGRSAGNRYIHLLWTVAATGLAARLLLAALSIGTNDALTFAEFGKEVRMFGVVGTYRADPWFNHPPLVGWWAGLLIRLLGAPNAPLWVAFPFKVNWAFSFLFKLPVMAADAVGVWLLWRRWSRVEAADPGKARLVPVAIAAGFAWSLGSILIGAFHANTDPAYAMLCLLSVWLMEDRRAFFWSGLALGAAINVKIIPVLLLPPLLFRCASKSEARAFVVGLAMAFIPFLPAVLQAFPSFYNNVLGYNPPNDAWGFDLLLYLSRRWAILASPADSTIHAYHIVGRYVLLALVLAWAIVAWRLRRWDGYEVAAVTMAIFLVSTPGFGIQYIVPVGLLMFAVRPKLAIAYSIACGVFLLNIYVRHWQPPLIPFRSLLTGPLDAFDSLPGLPAWGLLVYFLFTTVLRKRESVSIEDGRERVRDETTELPARAAA